jgi:hypothetical protein
MRFCPWMCNCGCPIFLIERPEHHTQHCAAFAPPNIHHDEGGSD